MTAGEFEISGALDAGPPDESRMQEVAEEFMEYMQFAYKVCVCACVYVCV